MFQTWFWSCVSSLLLVDSSPEKAEAMLPALLCPLQCLAECLTQGGSWLNIYLMNDWKDFQRSFGPTLSLKTRRMRPRERSDWPMVTLLLRSKSSGCDPDFRTHVPVLFLLNLQKVNRDTGQIFFKLPMESGLNGRCNHRTWFLDLFSCIYFAMCLLSKQERPAPLGKWLIH